MKTSLIWNSQYNNVIDISFAGDQVLSEFLDGLVQEHQRQDDLVSTEILTDFAPKDTYIHAWLAIANYLLTESEAFMRKYQTETLLYID